VDGEERRGMLSGAARAVEFELFSTDMDLSFTLFMCQNLYMKGFSCIQDIEKSSLKRKLLTAVQRDMSISTVRKTSVLMLLIEEPVCTYFY
jgi:hypothetical protein